MWVSLVSHFSFSCCKIFLGYIHTKKQSTESEEETTKTKRTKQYLKDDATDKLSEATTDTLVGESQNNKKQQESRDTTELKVMLHQLETGNLTSIIPEDMLRI